jgi:hypothetical protein
VCRFFFKSLCLLFFSYHVYYLLPSPKQSTSPSSSCRTARHLHFLFLLVPCILTRLARPSFKNTVATLKMHLDISSGRKAIEISFYNTTISLAPISLSVRTCTVVIVVDVRSECTAANEQTSPQQYARL